MMDAARRKPAPSTTFPWLVLVLTALLLTGCANQFPSSESAAVLAPIVVTGSRQEIDSNVLASLERSGDLWGRLGQQLTWNRDHPAITLERDKFLAQPRLFDVLSERANPGLAYIVEEIQRRGLPMELAIVPIVESMLDPWAYSSQRAAGLWQISPATGSHYGLDVSWWYDARLDIPVATEFALDYLTELHTEFDGDWQLALAAYNGGRGRVARAIARAKKYGHPMDYWSLGLPRETRRYLPRILGMAELIARPDTYGLTLSELPIDPAIAVVDTQGQIEMAKVARLAGIEVGEVRRLNPAHIRWATPPEGSHRLWLPAQHALRFSESLADLPPSERVEWAHYTIAPGDSLNAIARRFDTKAGLLKVVNEIDNSFIRAGDELMIPRGIEWTDRLVDAGTDWPPSTSRQYRVKSGDSLWLIARRHNVAVNDLRSWNNLRKEVFLQPGQILEIRR